MRSFIRTPRPGVYVAACLCKVLEQTFQRASRRHYFLNIEAALATVTQVAPDLRIAHVRTRTFDCVHTRAYVSVRSGNLMPTCACSCPSRTPNLIVSYT
eukprot:3439964-Pleurochrysis_carterae.AAC.2